MTAAGPALTNTGINPMDALVLMSTIYGFLASPLLILLLWLTNRRSVMGERTNGWLLNTLGGIAAAATVAGAVGLVITWFMR